jgi:type VI secretion system protein ImpH
VSAPAPAAARVHASLRALLARSAATFDFPQVVRALERMYPDRTPVGGFGDPAAEVVRFGVRPSLGFPPGDVAGVTVPEHGDPGQPTVEVNFMGLVGPAGVLPHVYTQQVAERTAARDTAPRDFLDLFQHRLVSLFYRAWRSTRLHVAVGEPGEADRLTTHLRDLVGVGTRGLADRLAAPDEVLVHYAALLLPRTRPAAALAELARDFLGAACAVEEFVGAWYPLAEGTQCALGEDAECAALGVGSVVGDAVWDHTARVRLRVGPLTRAQYDALLPGGARHAAFASLVRFFTDGALDVEVRLVLARDEVPGCVLGAATGALGWGTWLSTRTPSRDPDETTFLA